jgi:C-terminal processing protease CtpA/Prc
MQEINSKKLLLLILVALCLAWQPRSAWGQDETVVISSEAREYLDAVVDIIQKTSVKRTNNWDEFRRLTILKAAKAQTPADTYPAIRDALQRLADNHSRLFTPDEVKAPDAGRTSGGRIDFGLRVKNLVVVTVYPNSSASRASVQVRDRILAFDGNTLSADADYTDRINEAKKNGVKGVELTFQRSNEPPRKMTLDFGEYDRNLPVSGKVAFDNIGLIELPAFVSGLTDEIRPRNKRTNMPRACKV